MAYDEYLEERLGRILKRRKGVTTKKMFGGLCYLLNGNMVCGIVGETLMLRLGEAGATAALEEKHVRPMDFTGKPIKTMVYVDPDGFETDEMLRAWVGRALEFGKTLPAKAK